MLLKILFNLKILRTKALEIDNEYDISFMRPNSVQNSNQIRHLHEVYNEFVKNKSNVPDKRIINSLSNLNWLFISHKKKPFFSVYFKYDYVLFKNENESNLIINTKETNEHVLKLEYDPNNVKKYKFITIYSIYVYPDFRGRKFLGYFFRMIKKYFEFDYLGLSVKQDDRFFLVNIYNYMKLGFNFGNTSNTNLDIFFLDTYKNFLKLKNIFDLNIFNELKFRKYLCMFCSKDNLLRKIGTLEQMKIKKYCKKLGKEFKNEIKVK